MNLLNKMELTAVIQQTLQNKPFLGICLGLQTLMTLSEESGGTQGFGFITGKVRRFLTPLLDVHGATLKIPHMGWNQVHQTVDHPLWQTIPENSRFYFVHSYYVDPEEKSVIAGTTEYGRIFTSVIAKDNVFAIQFHPEKSQQAGLTLLKNFLAW